MLYWFSSWWFSLYLLFWGELCSRKKEERKPFSFLKLGWLYLINRTGALLMKRGDYSYLNWDKRHKYRLPSQTKTYGTSLTTISPLTVPTRQLVGIFTLRHLHLRPPWIGLTLSVQVSYTFSLMPNDNRVLKWWPNIIFFCISNEWNCLYLGV